MKATAHARVRTLIQVAADVSDVSIRPGACGTVVEAYTDPEAYAVDLEIADPTVVGEVRDENVV
jgi:hypothetical protein